MNLTEKYRPRVLADIVGQPWLVCQLEAFVAEPVSCAFLFEGGTGTGKTSAAIALARELGVDVDAGPLGGFNEIASGEQTADSVRRVMDGLRLHTMTGSGWKVLVVNEADCISQQASFVWLDALENLPARTVIVFTTNDAHRLPRRLRDRCESHRFESGFIALAPYLPDFIARVWHAETGRTDAPDLDQLGPIQDDAGDVSIRRVVQMLAPLIRRPAAIATPPAAAPIATPAARAATITAQVEELLRSVGAPRSRLDIQLQLAAATGRDVAAAVGSALAALLKRGKIKGLGKAMYCIPGVS